MKTTPQTRARERAGFTLQEAARRVRGRSRTRLSNAMRYLRHIELHGGASDLLCRQLSALYGCRDDLFFFSPDYWEKWETVKGIDAVTGERLKTSTALVAGTDGAVPMKASAFRSARGADTMPSHRATRRSRKQAAPQLELV
jgi:hypothetical protein